MGDPDRFARRVGIISYFLHEEGVEYETIEKFRLTTRLQRELYEIASELKNRVDEIEGLERYLKIPGGPGYTIRSNPIQMKLIIKSDDPNGMVEIIDLSRGDYKNYTLMDWLKLIEDAIIGWKGAAYQLLSKILFFTFSAFLESI